MTRKPKVDPREVLADADLDRLLAEPHFLRFVWRLLQLSGWNDQSFTGDAGWTAYREGRRAVAIEVLNQLTARDGDALMLVLATYARDIKNLTGKPLERPDDRPEHLYGSTGDGAAG